METAGCIGAEGGSALVGGHRVVWHVLNRNVVRADEAAPCGSAGS
jgi:hypothetical protein